MDRPLSSNYCAARSGEKQRSEELPANQLYARLSCRVVALLRLSLLRDPQPTLDLQCRGSFMSHTGERACPQISRAIGVICIATAFRVGAECRRASSRIEDGGVLAFLTFQWFIREMQVHTT